jgi:hypothetical protein
VVISAGGKVVKTWAEATRAANRKQPTIDLNFIAENGNSTLVWASA